MLIDKTILKSSKVVLFGAGDNGRRIYDGLTAERYTIAYFVDNNNNADEVKGIPVYAPEKLLLEDKAKLKIIITPAYPAHHEIEEQLAEMELSESIFEHYKFYCWYFNSIWFYGDSLLICTYSCTFRHITPRYPYLDTAQESIENFLTTRAEIINELNGDIPINQANHCVNCPFLCKTSVLLDESTKLSYVAISCSPSLCQCRCIYCERYINESNKSQYHLMVSEIFRYLESKKMLSQYVEVLFASGEICIMPQKEMLLELTSKYRSEYRTNAFLFDPIVAKSIEKEGNRIQVSLDSGTRETFALIKGCDMFDTVIDNLKEYIKHGKVEMKYIVLPGINDSNEDIEGIINILKSLNLNRMILMFDRYYAIRTACYAYAKLIENFTINCIDLEQRFSMSLATKHLCQDEIFDTIKKHYPLSPNSVYEQRSRHFREVFGEKYRNDYQGYRNYIQSFEIIVLLNCFCEGTRFTLVETTDNPYMCTQNKRIKSDLKRIEDFVFDTAELSQISETMSDNTIFIVYDRDNFNIIKSELVSKGINGNSILDLEGYLFSIEPTDVWLKINTLNNLREDFTL